jgi:hypothetical protein
MAAEKKESDISEMKESLGTIMATFTYIYDPYAIIKEIDIIMSFESAMLDFGNRWTEPIWGPEGILTDIPNMGKRAPINRPTEKQAQQRRVKNYKELFETFRMWWTVAVSVFNSQTGNWKDSIIICSKLRADLMRIAVKEGLVSLSGSMYSISLRQTSNQPDEEFFVGNET